MINSIYQKFSNVNYERNIITQVHYIPVPLQYYYKKIGYNVKNLKML